MKQKRGFALLSKEKLAEISSLGGKASHEQGKAHEFTHEEAVEAGQKGGLARGVKWRELQAPKEES